MLLAWAHTAPPRPFTSGLSRWLFPLGQGATESLGAPFAEGPSLCPFLFVYTVTGSRRLSQAPRGRLVALLFHAEVLRNTCQAMRTISLYCFSLGLIVTHTDVATGAAWGGGGTVAAPSFWLPTLGHRAGATSSLRREATVFPQDDFASVFQKHRDLASGEAVWPFVEKELLGGGR